MADTFQLEQVLVNDYRKPAITVYNRLEASPRTSQFDRSLKAEVRDPLWMLTRQWQFGEFKGEDAGSAVTTQIERDHTVMDRVSFPDNNIFPYNADIPLETFVERETLRPELGLAVKLARYFIRLMRRDGLFTNAVLNKFITKYPLNYMAHPNDIEGKQLLISVNNKVFDGYRVLQDINTPDGGGTRFQSWVTGEALTEALTGLGNNLNDYYKRVYSQPVNGATAWLPSQLEYQFNVASPTDQQTQKTLVAPQYSEGHLDWYSFDFSSDIRIGLDPEPPVDNSVLEPVSFIPSSVSFKGMPNPRYWMMEDSRTDFGKMDTTPTGLLHLLLAEFGLIYSNDWFILPYPLTANTLCELKNIVVTDTFGQQILIRPAGRGAESNWHRWNLFHHRDINNQNSNTNLFYLAPVISQSLNGPPVEQVNFLRDEMANLVWAVETIVPSQSGKGMRGNEIAIPLEPTEATEEEPVEETTGTEEKPKIKYVLGTTVPRNWTPFIPVHIGDDKREIRLQRAKMPDPEPELAGPYGVLLTEKPAPYYVNEEEIGRSGVLLQRNWQLACWYLGKRYLWLGRSKQNGKGEGWSNLKFDQIQEIKQ